MLKKIFKIICKIIIFLLIILLFLAVIRPAYIKYKENKKVAVVDKSGELAVPKEKALKESQKEEKNSESDEEGWKLERKEEYDPFNFDDRILLYEGKINSNAMNELVDILIEDFDSKTFSKVDINLNGNDFSYSDKDTYISNLQNLKNSIIENGNYTVNFEYNTIRTTVNKLIITQN